MFYEKMTKHKTSLNAAKYKDDIKKIINAMLKEDKTFEHYHLYKEEYDVFIQGILGKMITINTPTVILEMSEPLPIDRTIYLKQNKKSVIDMMIQKNTSNPENKLDSKAEKTNNSTIIETIDSTHESPKKSKKGKLKLDI